ncbi:MAG: ABC transporter ATP-binding protein [Microthrixaceae bacterium]
MTTDRPGGAAIEATDLVVDYETAAGRVRALELDHLSVPSGGGVAVMGPSGCGKSTLLGLLAALAVPSSGLVRIGAEAVSDMSDRQRCDFRRRNLGMVYQADNLLPHLTVEENVALPVAIAGVGATSDTMETLDRLGLGTLAQRLPDELSGGQRQRVAVARAIGHRPSVVLADEPTGSLDAANARGVVRLLVEVHRALGATLVMVTHDPDIAGHLERTVYLRPAAGRLTDASREASHVG